MADTVLGSFWGSGSYGDRLKFQVEYSYTQDASANTTSITFKGWIYVDSDYSGGYGSDDSTFKIAGTTIKSGSYRYYGTGWTEIGSTTKTYTHGADGKFPDTNVTFSANSYHFNNDSATKSITSSNIPDIAATLTVSVSDLTVTYDGEAHNQTMTITSSRTGDTFANAKVNVGTNSSTYSGDNGVQNGTPGTDGKINVLSTGLTHAGTKTYYYKVNGTGYTGDKTGSFKITINKANLSATHINAPTGKTVTYNGSAQALVNAGSLKGIALNADASSVKPKIQYKLGSGSWQDSIPTATALGTYTVYYRIVGNGDMNDWSGSSVTAKIQAQDTILKIVLPNGVANLAGVSGSTITWPKGSQAAAGTYTASTRTWSKTFKYTSDATKDKLDFPNIQSYVNNTTYVFSTANTENNASGFLMVGYSTSATPTNLNYHEGKTYALSAAGGTITLYPRLMWFKIGTYEHTFDNTIKRVQMTPQAASGSNRIAATGVTIKADTAAKNAPNAPAGTTSKGTSTGGTALYIDNNLNKDAGIGDTGIYRIGLTFSITSDGETFTKTGHTTDNYLKIKQAPRNIVLNPATITLPVMTRRDNACTITTWDDLDSSASTANVLSASLKANVGPATVSRGGKVTITTQFYPGTVNVNVTIPETMNYLTETKPIVVTITGGGNGIYWYDPSRPAGQRWVATKPYVWNGVNWSDDFI